MEREPTTEQDGPSDVQALQERVRALEAELADRAEATNAALAAAQDRVYWLDRFRLDLNALMSRPTGLRLAKALPVLGRIRYLAGRVRSTLRPTRRV
jgi:hypothetical protein